jgi:hypothetical protein
LLSKKSKFKGDPMKFLSLRLLALVFSLLLLHGCAIVPAAKDGEALKSNQGLLAFHVSSNSDATLSFIDYANTSTFGSRFGENMVGPKGLFRIKAGETFYVVPLDAGEYMFSKFSAYPRYAWMQATNRFKVSANTITYIGHIRISVKDYRYSLQALDRELDMRSHLADTYPTYFKSMGFEKSIAQLSLQPQDPNAANKAAGAEK